MASTLWTNLRRSRLTPSIARSWSRESATSRFTPILSPTKFPFTSFLQPFKSFSSDSVSDKIKKMQAYFDQYADEYVEDDDDELMIKEAVPAEKTPVKSVETIDEIVFLLVDQRAKDIVVLDDLRDTCSIIDSLIICSSFNGRHGTAIAEALRRASKTFEIVVSKRSMRLNSGWFQVDIGGIQVNVMSEDVRLRYDLEGLWGAGEEESEPEIPLIPPARS